MRRIYVSSLSRAEEHATGIGEVGRLYVYDWDTKLPLCDPIVVVDGRDPRNPNSRSHGARGVAWYNDNLYVAGCGPNGKITRINPSTYQVEATLQFPGHLSCIHQMHGRDGALWVCSTETDRLYRIVDEEVADFWDLKIELPEVIVSTIESSDLGRDKPWGAGRAHFNSVSWNPAGKEFHIYMYANLVYNVTDKAVVHRGYPLDGPHDLCFLDNNRLLVNCSSICSTYMFDLNGRERPKLVYQAEHIPDKSQTHAIWGFTRGLAYAQAQNYLIIGSCPGTLNGFQADSLTKETELVIIEDPFECIYSILLDPRDWS